MVELHGGAVEVAVLQQVVHANANLENALVQVSDLRRCGAPLELECLVLLEEFARVELVEGLAQLGWRGLGTCALEVRVLESIKGTRELGMTCARRRHGPEQYTDRT